LINVKKARQGGGLIPVNREEERQQP